MKKKLISLFLCLALLVSSFAFPVTAATPPFRVIAYIYNDLWGNGSALDNVDASKITHINYSFGLFDLGSVTAAPSGVTAGRKGYRPLANPLHVTVPRDTTVLTKVMAMKQRNPDLKVLLSIGGWGADGFSDAASSATNRTAFANECLRLCTTYGFDGIDLDWEYPGHGGWSEISFRSADPANYALALQAIRTAIGSSRLLTIAGGSTMLSGEANMTGTGIASTLNFVNLMTYDYDGSNGINAPYDWTIATAQSFNTQLGFAKSNINIGEPFYSHSSTKALDELSYNELVALLANGATVSIGNEGNVNYNGGVAHIDTPEMIRKKMQWVKTNGFGGGMFWELSHDKNNDLLNTMYSNLNGDGTYQSPYMPIPNLPVAPPLAFESITANASGTVAPSTSVTWTASATGGTGSLTYKFDVIKDNVTVSTGSYQSSASFNYTLSQAGQYKVTVTVKDGNNATVSGTSALITVVPLAFGSITANTSGNVAFGTNVTWTASATGGSAPYTYKFDVLKDNVTVSTGSYQSSATFNYALAYVGGYKVTVTIKDDKGTTVSGTSAVLNVLGLSIKSIAPTVANGTASYTVTAEGGSPAYRYSFYVLKDGVVWKSTSYTTTNSFTFNPADAAAEKGLTLPGGSGKYTVRIYVDDTFNTRAVNATLLTL
ncbi:MAG: hypothetical protein LBS74_03710 [Oscillospiraceae bacterium]|jgi:chitinase|nr:hypothetical protein [Oscillospiraceae bacterium]